MSLTAEAEVDLNEQAHASTEPAEDAVEDIPAAPPRKARRKRRLFFIMLMLLVAGGVTAAVVYAMHARHFESTDDAFIDGPVIPISPRVAGQINEVRVSDNSEVKKGQVLVVLDPRLYDVALEQANAAQSAAEGRLRQSRSQINAAQAAQAEARATMAVAQANATSTHSDLSRYQEVAAKAPQAVSKQQVDSAVAAEQSAEAQIAQAQARVTAADAQLVSAQAAVQAAQGDLKRTEADVQKARVDREYCSVTAPQDGRVTRKNVEVGSYVQIGQPLLALVSHDVWVVANFKETQLDRMKPGQAVKIEVDAYPGKTFIGKLDSIQSGTGSRFSMLPTENATGNFVKVVQRVPVKIVFSDPGQTNMVQRLLSPGMSATPEVKVR